MNPASVTRKDAFLALLDLVGAAKSAAAHLGPRIDPDQVVGYVEETLNILAGWDNSVPPCLGCDTPVRPPAERCRACQAQHDEDEAMLWDDAHPPRPTPL